MATIYDVAKRARVSTATVSAVLNGTAYVSPELTSRVNEAVKELDYTINAIARGLQTRRTNMIGMLVPDIAEPVYSVMVKGVESGLKTAGCSLLIASTHNQVEEQSRYLRMLRSKQVDGMLALLAFGDESELAEMVAAKRPLVFIARRPTFEADCVLVDNVGATTEAVSYLLGKGRRRVGLIVGPRSLAVSQDRIAGWRKAHQQHGVPADEALIAEGDYTSESGEAAMEAFLRLEQPPDAVFATGFLMMTGCLGLLRARGIAVPDSVELMTWSDSPLLDVFDPPVSTIQQPSYEMGVRAAELVLSRIENPDASPTTIILPAELRIRTPRAPAGVQVR
ncbi:MAG: LacI family DNA-binding transcriptional regulator [Acidobacteria bacterium]|nr:LacI family DNA-binding transcriptional regulator [Acidobacteriota bacterium]